MELVAEVKTKSPFGFKSTKSWEELLELAIAHGDVVAVHTHPDWGGSWKRLARAVKKSVVPVLAKGLHRTDDDLARAWGLGAKYVLTVNRDLAALAGVWYEPLRFQDLEWLPPGVKLVWNQRDLKTGLPKHESFAVVREYWSGWLCQASFIRSDRDVHPGADAVLVGSFLRRYLGML